MIILARYITSPETYAKWVIEGFQYRNVGKISYEKIQSILQKEEENIDDGIRLNNVKKLNLMMFVFHMMMKKCIKSYII